MVRYSCEGRIITVIQNKAIKHICLIYCVPRNSGIAFNRYTHGPENNGNPNESLEGSKSNGLQRIAKLSKLTCTLFRWTLVLVNYIIGLLHEYCSE
jgi:hypothetical protein